MDQLIERNIVSDARRNSPPVVGGLRAVDPQLIYLSVITLGEINRGVENSARRIQRSPTDYRFGYKLSAANIGTGRLPVAAEIAMVWGHISGRRSHGNPDALIAATAAVHGLVVVTRNTADFDETGVPVVNPWDDA